MPPRTEKRLTSSNLTYDGALLFWRTVTNIFFREIRPRGAFNIPNDGPVIFVAAPHHNQVCVSKVGLFTAFADMCVIVLGPAIACTAGVPGNGTTSEVFDCRKEHDKESSWFLRVINGQ